MHVFAERGFSKYYTLQFLRFVAALFVMLFHLDLMHSGYKGVNIFFVISGFVLYYSTLIVTHKSAAIFLINRLTKIYLLYWLVLLAFYFIIPFKLDKAFVKTLFLLPGHESYIQVSWSLSYELYFYFAFAVVVYVLKNTWYMFSALFAISSFVVILGFTSFSLKGSVLNFLLGQNFWQFLLGIFCCVLVNRVTIRRSLTVLYSALFGTAITIISIPYVAVQRFVIYGLMAFPLVFYLVQYEKKTILNKHITYTATILGDASYAMYLTAPIITTIIPPVNLLVKLVIIVLVITVSIIVNRFIENPLLKSARSLATALVSRLIDRLK